MTLKDKQDDRADLPTKYSLSSGSGGGDGVRLFFRLPIVSALRPRAREGNGRSQDHRFFICNRQYDYRPAAEIKVEV